MLDLNGLIKWFQVLSSRGSIATISGIQGNVSLLIKLLIQIALKIVLPKLFKRETVAQIALTKTLHGRIEPRQPRSFLSIKQHVSFIYDAGFLYNRRGVLQINRSEGLHDMGALRPELVGCVGCVFIILYFSLFKGVKSSGKVLFNCFL